MSRTGSHTSGLAIAAVPAVGLALLLAFAVGLAASVGSSAGCGSGAALTGTLKGGVPKKFVPIYMAAAEKYGLGPRGPSILASIHFNETSFGTNTNNTTGSGAEGQMMFMPETWARYGVDGDGDGRKDPYDPDDAIFAAARYLRASGAPGNWHDAIFAYNHAEWYVQRVEADARRFGGAGMESVAGGELGEACSSIGSEAMLHHAQRLFRPREFKTLPDRLWVGDGSPEQVDARIWPDAVWLLETYDLRVTAAREGGHQTHGDGTAMDMVPATGNWDATAKRAAEDLGWTEGCGSSGVRPVCKLVPAIHFIGYNGYPLHGDPQHSSLPHLHVSWESSDYGGCPETVCGPDAWVMVFPLREGASS
jgi:Transglycosylase SLT domain